MARQSPLEGCTGFDWDKANAAKNWERHHVTRSECEEVFFLEPLVVAAGAERSLVESRHYALGQTLAGRRLFIVFTLRWDLIRVISARPMSRRERRVYERAKEESEASPED